MAVVSPALFEGKRLGAPCMRRPQFISTHLTFEAAGGDPMARGAPSLLGE